jgi:hypothetical protein
MLVDREPLRRDQIVTNQLAQFERGMRATLAGIKKLSESAPRLSPVREQLRR